MELISSKVNLANLILIELLVKEPQKRLTLNEVLLHPWITKDLSAVREARRNSLPENAFAVYSLPQPSKADLLNEKI